MEKLENKGSVLWKWLHKLRGVFLALPVIAVALLTALRNLIRLPETVCFSSAALNEVGNLVFQNIYISKGLAVWGPFGITVLCAAMICMSRRVVYPFLISLFSLTVPFVLYWVNMFQ